MECERFRILRTGLSKELLERCPENVAFSTVEPYELAAWKNHRQTLNRLSERGGLSPVELVSILEKRPLYGPRSLHISDEEAVDRLLELLKKIELLGLEDRPAERIEVGDLCPKHDMGREFGPCTCRWKGADSES